MSKHINQADYKDLVKLISKGVVDAIRDSNRLKDGLNTYQKTEKILRSFPKLKSIIKQKQKQIKQLRQYGIPKKSKDVVNYGSITNTPDIKLMEEQVEDRVKDIRATMRRTQKYIEVIENALVSINDDPYYDIIVMFYFEGKDIDVIAQYLEHDETTIRRHKSRLVNQVRLILFPDETVAEFF
jgi:hypothetical protein